MNNINRAKIRAERYRRQREIEDILDSNMSRHDKRAEREILIIFIVAVVVTVIAGWLS